MKRGLLDTSVVVALGKGEKVELPDESAISVLTLCGLHHGVLVASDAERPGRLATLTMVERAFDALAVDSRVAPHFGALMSSARARGGRPGLADTLIAATALSHGLPIYSRDNDFARLELPALIMV